MLRKSIKLCTDLFQKEIVFCKDNLETLFMIQKINKHMHIAYMRSFGIELQVDMSLDIAIKYKWMKTN
jgi:hypothetical protein